MFNNSPFTYKICRKCSKPHYTGRNYCEICQKKNYDQYKRRLKKMLSTPIKLKPIKNNN